MGAGRPGRSVGVDEALAAIADGSRIYLTSGCGVPTALVDALAARHEQWRRLEVVVSYLIRPLSLFARAGRPFRFTSLHPTGALGDLDRDYLDVVPLRYGDHPAVLGCDGSRTPDVALVQVSPPDRRGRCSLGVSVGTAADAVRAAGLVIAQVNELMPYTFGDAEIEVDDVDLLVHATTPLVELPPTSTSPLARAIAGHVAGEVPAGATLQVGIGQVPAAVLSALADHRDLGLCGGIFTEGCRRLVETDVVAAPCVTAELVGDASLFAWAHRNPALRVVGATTSHGLGALSRVARLVAVNSALEVDLTGAANVEVTRGGEVVSGPGGLPDFAVAALASRGGRSIVALPSRTAAGRSRIVDALSGPTALPSYLADRVVTEHGVARLRGRSLVERRRDLRQLAAR